MALVIPNIESAPTFAAQSAVDSTDLAIIAALGDRTGVVSGCLCTFNSGMVVSVASGQIMLNGVTYPVGATSVTFAAAGVSDRRDMIVATVSGGNVTVQRIAGALCNTANWTSASLPALPPVKSAIPANSVVLGEVYVQGGAGSLSVSNIVDKTALIGISKGETLGEVNYNPSSVAAYAFSTSTGGAVDATNLTVTFVAPASGAVNFSFDTLCSMSSFSSSETLLVGYIHDVSTGSDVGGAKQTFCALLAAPAGGPNLWSRIHFEQQVGGLTPGKTYQWTPGYYTNATASQMNAGGWGGGNLFSAGPFHVMVKSA